jgi:DNA-binding XRE family transcriptional regulator
MAQSSADNQLNSKGAAMRNGPCVDDTGIEPVADPVRGIVDVLNAIANLSDADRSYCMKGLRSLAEDDSKENFLAVMSLLTEILAKKPVTVVPFCVGESSANTEWKKRVGKLVKRFREEKGWTQEELSSKAKLPQSHISRIENEQISPTRKTVKKICDALGLSVGDIDPSA